MFTQSYKHTFLAALLFCFPTLSQADVTLWHDIAAKNSTNSDSGLILQRALTLDAEQLRARVQTATAQSAFSLVAPLPDGRNIPVTLQPTPVLSPELQQRYPDINTWRIQSEHADILSGRAELTARGFHIMLRTQDGDQWLIEPETAALQAALNRYKSYSKRQAYQEQTSQQQPRTFSCGATLASNSDWQIPQHSPMMQAWQSSQHYAQRAGKNLLSYDIAIAATGEYTQQFGGSKAAAYGAIVTTVSRINDIYEQELGITFKLVSGTETVFTNPATDPFDNDASEEAVTQNQGVLDTLVGSNRYDIGHVLGSSLGGDGIALVSSICREGKKAQGFTASNVVAGDSFIVDYVAHELGHQLGATHTFNSTLSSCGAGGRIASTAFEPGSGNTIMSYAGLCASDNIQSNVDPQFHTGSIAQIHALTHNGRAASCATHVSLSNNLPVVNAGADHTIPARAPFILNGSASDADGDKLLYGWDQLDTGTASRLGTDTTNNPLVMSNPLSNSGTRSIPNISRLLNTAQTTSHGESLPRSNRDMNFRLSVRDGKGATSSDDVKLTVHDTGERFSILTPTTSLSPGDHEISWQVASTDAAPINCQQVDIAYTNDQGVTFHDVLLKTANDGSETVTLTNRAAHIRVKCSDNIFFALSGTTPHIAAYRSDNDQSTDGNDNGGMVNLGGGGGSLPLPLVLAGLLAILMRLYSSVYLDRTKKYPL